MDRRELIRRSELLGLPVPLPPDKLQVDNLEVRTQTGDVQQIECDFCGWNDDASNWSWQRKAQGHHARTGCTGPWVLDVRHALVLKGLGDDDEEEDAP